MCYHGEYQRVRERKHVCVCVRVCVVFVRADNVQLMMEQMEGIIQSGPITRLNVTTTWGFFPLLTTQTRVEVKGGRDTANSIRLYGERQRATFISALLLPFSSLWKLRDHFLSEMEKNSIFRLAIRDGMKEEQKHLFYIV